MTHLLHYDLLAEFKRQFFKDLLTVEHVKGTQIKIDKISFPDGGIDEQANFWGYEFNKNGVKYLLSSKTKAEDGTAKELVLSEILPIFARAPQKVAYRGVVYYQIKKPVSAKIRPVKHYDFRKLLDLLSSIPHSNPTHQKLAWFIEIAQNIDRANVRISSPPGFGKDSTVAIMGDLVGNCATVENPTIAKLEYMHSYKHLALNEVVGIKNQAWRDIELYLLSVGAFKSTITKRSRATETTKEEMNVSKLCLSLFYNDIDTYTNEPYFDDIAKGAVCDRFVPLRLYGGFTEQFKSISSSDITKTVETNMEYYKQIVGTLAYYASSYMTEYHGYNQMGLMKVPQRWLFSLSTVLRIIDVYCESQEEFDKWIAVINQSIEDYMEMLRYPLLIRGFAIKHLGFTKEEVADKSVRQIHQLVEALPFERKERLAKEIAFLFSLNKVTTFIKKNILIGEFNHNGNVKAENHGFW